MKILQVTHRYPPHHGGVEYHTRSLARWLARDHDVTVLTTFHPDVPSNYLDGGVRVLRFRVIASPMRNPIAPGLILKLARLKESYDVVHFHVPYAFTSLAGMLLTHPRSTVVTLHGRPYYEGVGKVILRMYEPIVFRVVRKAAFVIALTDADRDYLRKMGVSDRRIRLIPNFIDIGEIVSAVGNVVERQPGPRLRLIFVGSLTERKGILELVRALSRLEDVDLTVIGKGPLEEEIRKAAGRMIEERRVQLVGVLDNRADVWRAIHDSDALILPSKSEGLPTVVLESLALGRPAILSDIPNHRSVFGDSAVYFDPNDPRSLRDALEALRASYGYLSARGRELVTKYDVSQVAPKILSLYHEIVSEGEGEE